MINQVDTICTLVFDYRFRPDEKSRIPTMPAGDAQRAWFPAMLSELEQFWDSEMSWNLLAKFCHQMTEFARR